MDEGQVKALREKFPPTAVGLLPKPLYKDAQKGNCQECGKYHGLPAVHLDYVGHAVVTDRLLDVDPAWTWEPLALDEAGLPAIDRAGNLWMKLTIAGVTRLGVGDGMSMKERIGDAIRNAAMRFGVALDLWSKEELSSDHQAPAEQPAPDPLSVAKNRVWAMTEGRGTEEERKAFIAAACEAQGLSKDSAEDLIKLADGWAQASAEAS